MSDPIDDLHDDETSGSWGRWILRQAASWGLTLLGVVVLMQAVGWLRAPSLPEQAPSFVLQDLDGRDVALSDFRGQTVVLNFWATWCGPCRVEIPSFSRFAERHPEVVVLGVAADGPAAKLRRASRDLGISYTVLQGEPEVLAAYGVSSYPTTVVVGPEGEVRSAHVGVLFGPQLAWATGRLW